MERAEMRGRGSVICLYGMEVAGGNVLNKPVPRSTDIIYIPG